MSGRIIMARPRQNDSFFDITSIIIVTAFLGSATGHKFVGLNACGLQMTKFIAVSWRLLHTYIHTYIPAASFCKMTQIAALISRRLLDYIPAAGTNTGLSKSGARLIGKMNKNAQETSYVLGLGRLGIKCVMYSTSKMFLRT